MGSCPHGGGLSKWGVIPVVNCSGGELGSYPGWELSWWGITLVRRCPDGDLLLWGIVLIENCPSEGFVL